MELKQIENETELENHAIMHKDQSLNRLDLSFLKHIKLCEYKTSELLAYWIHDFSAYHDEERTFNIAKSGIYSRGDIVKANLGFNVGNELGGLHYCVVLNKYDNTRNGVANVIPLTSKKENKRYDSSTVNLGNELYNILQEKLIKEKEKLQKLLEEIEKIENIPNKVQNAVKKEMNYINKLGEEISKMKQDSIALIAQITTISKQRIYKNPLLKSVKISNQSLDLIDQKIIQYFTK